MLRPVPAGLAPRARRGERVLVEKVLISRIKNARLVIHPNDHLPPHFHVEVAGGVHGGAKYNIETLDRMDGDLPGHLERAIRRWARENQTYLRERWRSTRPTDIRATL